MAIYRSFHSTGWFDNQFINMEQKLLMQVTMNGRVFMDKAVELIRELTPFDTGYMFQQVKAWGFRRYSLGGFNFRAGWRKQDFRKFYPPYVEHGTGVYGQFKTRIVPKTASRLVWIDASGFHSAKSVRGQEAQEILPGAAKKWFAWSAAYINSMRGGMYRGA